MAFFTPFLSAIVAIQAPCSHLDSPHVALVSIAIKIWPSLGHFLAGSFSILDKTLYDGLTKMGVYENLLAIVGGSL